MHPMTRSMTQRGDQIDRSGDCWVWTGALSGGGYGHFTYQGRTLYAHRAAYEEWVGPIPEGMHVLHHCDNPPCVRPSHLYLGTVADNMQDRSRKERGRGQRYQPNPS